MNRIFSLLLASLCLVSSGHPAFSEGALSPDSTWVKLVYVHGTNQNIPESRAVFKDRVDRLHAEIQEAFAESEAIQEHLLKSGQANISTEPVVYFWGDRSHPEIEFLRHDLTLLEGIRTRLAGRARERLAYVLHDAVWFERPKNKYRILKDLHETVMSAHGENRPVVLMGHSAGSLVVFNYLTFLLPTLDTEAFLNLTDPPEEVARVIVSSDMPRTCALALLDSGAFRPDLSGQLVSTYDEQSGVGVAALSPESRQLYIEKLPGAIRDATRTSCLPPDAVKGMATFGSPIPLFESDVGRQGEAFSLLVSYMLKYLLENDMVWLHVNHINDPIGFPIPGYELIERIRVNHGVDIRPQGGMIAGNSNIRGGAFLQNAHGWYWDKPGDFARALVNTYENNYREWQARARQNTP